MLRKLGLVYEVNDFPIFLSALFCGSAPLCLQIGSKFLHDSLYFGGWFKPAKCTMFFIVILAFDKKKGEAL